MSVYDQVGGLRPGKSAFDLSYSNMFDADIGQLVPVWIQDAGPGDIMQIGASQITKMQPMVVPLYHRMNMCYHVFFVPYRILWADWQKFITGGITGDAVVGIPSFMANTDFPMRVRRYGIWDYAGFRLDDATDQLVWMSYLPHVNDFIWRAYWAIWRDYYRDENLQPNYPGTTIAVGDDESTQIAAIQAYMDAQWDTGGINEVYCDRLAYRCFKKDYFTSALPFQQRGTSPSIPFSGIISAQWPLSAFGTSASTGNTVFATMGSNPKMYLPTAEAVANARNMLNANTINTAGIGITPADLRYAMQVQKWMERSARGGYRYNEYLLAHFGEAPRDERLQRPEYVGGMMQPIVTSEVLQTSSTDTTSPQGSFAGHGMAVGQDFAGKYHVREHGVFIGMMSIMPEAVYQQGVSRVWTRQTRFDFYSPEFAHLSEQEIKLSELYYQPDDPTSNEERFAYQGAYDEYRTRQSQVCGKLASSLKYWTLSRIFSSPPSLNEAFMTTKALSQTRRQAWAVPGVAGNLQGEFLIRWNNNIQALRPMPYIPDPGLVDHF